MILFLYFIKRNTDQIREAGKEREEVKLPEITKKNVGTIYITMFLMDTKDIIGTYILLTIRLYY